MKRLAIIAGLGLALAIEAPAVAAPPDGPGPWADSVQSTQQGKRKNGTPVLPSRSNPTAALGVAERNDVEGTFYSLGYGGQVSLGYENPICNGTGADLELVESTIEPYQRELVDVYVSEDGVNYQLIASNVNKDALVSMPPDIEVAHFVRLVDRTVRSEGNNLSDGYDVDGVRALDTTSCVGTFTCRATALRVDLLELEPVIANDPNLPCADDSDTLISFPGETGIPSPVTTGIINASTDADPGGSPGGDAHADTSNTSIVLGSNTVTATSTESNAHVRCENGSPVLTSDSKLVGATVNGNAQDVGTDPVDIPVGAGPLTLGVLHFNWTDDSQPNVITQRAIYFEPTTPLGETIGEIVVAEAKADYEGNPC